MGGGGNNRNRRHSRTLYEDNDYNNGSNNTQSANGKDECDSFFLKTTLHNLQPACDLYSLGDILELSNDSSNNVIVVGSNGVCGTVVDSKVIKLQNCMDQGKSFKATITKKDDDFCEVAIQSKS